MGPDANDEYFASSTTSLTDKSSQSIIRPMDTDGQNISYSFGPVKYDIWSKDPLPAHRSGKISLTLVQNTGPASKVPATATYQFSTKDGSLKSDVMTVYGNANNTTITFNNVPKGTSSKPVYLVIVNKTDDFREIWGNGYTK